MAETRRNSIRTSRKARCGWSGETGKPIAQVARDLGINEGTLGDWVKTAPSFEV
jgi:transposase